MPSLQGKQALEQTFQGAPHEPSNPRSWGCSSRPFSCLLLLILRLSLDMASSGESSLTPRLLTLLPGLLLPHDGVSNFMG